MKITTKPLEYRTVRSAAAAVSWLNSQCGLWAGMSAEAQWGAYDDLESQGWSAVTDPMGQRYMAFLEEQE
jgi:hypothetical protein